MPNIFFEIQLPTALTVFIVIFSVIGVVGSGMVAYLALDERITEARFEDQFEFAPGPIDRGAALPDYVNEAALRTLATHHKLEELPSQIEESQGSKVTGGTPKGLLGGEKARGTKITHQPHDDLGEMIRKVVRHLYDSDELNQTVDRIYVDDILVESIPNFADPDSARQAFEAWFEENYADGFDGVSIADLAKKLAGLGQVVPGKKICERLHGSFEAVLANDSESALFLEGEWDVTDDDGTIVLRRTDLRIESNGQYGAPTERSIPMPNGASITMRLDGELTGHGQNRMVGVSRPVRASALATLKQYDPETGCFELVPIAVYQRIGNT